MSLRLAVQLGQQSQAPQLAQPPRPLRRFRAKRPVPGPRQQGLPEALDLGTEATAEDKRRVYLVTLPPPTQSRAASGERLVAPGSVAKHDVLAAFLDSCAHPAYTDWRCRFTGGSVRLEQCGMWREFCSASANLSHPEHDWVLVVSDSCL